jgi:hypothetical protein
MRGSEPILSLVGDIYDAALDPARWPEVLCDVRDFVGGCGASILVKDASTKTVNIHYDTGSYDPHYVQLYLDQYAKLDPTTTAHVMAEIGQPIAMADIMDSVDFANTRFYQEVGAAAAHRGLCRRGARQVGNRRRPVRDYPRGATWARRR